MHDIDVNMISRIKDDIKVAKLSLYAVFWVVMFVSKCVFMILVISDYLTKVGILFFNFCKHIVHSSNTC